jgi:hypothetical protein
MTPRVYILRGLLFCGACGRLRAPAHASGHRPSPGGTRNERSGSEGG